MEPRSSDTSSMVRSRRLPTTAKADVVNTYRVWLRYELFRGKLSDIAFQASEANLSEFIKARSNAKPHLGGADLTSIPPRRDPAILLLFQNFA